jgi:hypothetical protein
MEVGHGQEESEEGEKVGQEEKESSRSKDSCEEVRKEDRREEEGCGAEGARAQEGRRQEAPAPRDAHGGATGAGGCAPAVHGRDAGGENGAQPGGRLAVPDGVPALMGSE